MQDLSTTPSSTLSPPSPGASSYHATTPGTALTGGSPDNQWSVSANSRAHFGNTQPYRNPCSYSVKLSAKATPFTPRGTEDRCLSSSGGNSAQSTVQSDFKNHYIHEEALNDPFLTSDPEPAPRETSSTYSVLSETLSAPIDLVCASRYVEISQVPRNLAIEELSAALTNNSFGSPSLVILTELATNGVILLHFADIRDARAAVAQLQHMNSHWKCDFTSKDRFVSIRFPGKPLKAEVAEARVVATAICDGPSQAFEVRRIAQSVREFLASFGELLSWKITSTVFPELEIQVDYYDIDAAKSALDANVFKQAGVTVILTSLEDSGIRRQAVAQSHVYKNQQGSNSSFIDGVNLRHPHTSVTDRIVSDTARKHGYYENSKPVRSISLPNQASSKGAWGPLQTESTAHHTSLLQDQLPARNLFLGAAIGRPGRGNSFQSFRLRFDSPSGNHNVVDTHRIRQGLDVRTTVMLRNIPNKITQAMLKEILDQTSYGKYDFMYLRIDFANNCNVGYAFINFEDPWHIIDFVQTRAGRRWNCFNSDKVAEVSYATIQGKDCLIQKFRNSSVMMEHPTFRPKIYRTGCGPDAGQEESFPGPDNTSKMRRSVENAEHVGLFAPRGMHQVRDEHRRRRSQFDRGTRHAEVDSLPDYESRLLPPTVEAVSNHQLYGSFRNQEMKIQKGKHLGPF